MPLIFGMKIEVNLEKKYFFGIVGVLLLIAGVIGVVASYTQAIPNPGHGGDTTWVEFSGIQQ